jgi:hypothetical protein
MDKGFKCRGYRYSIKGSFLDVYKESEKIMTMRVAPEAEGAVKTAGAWEKCGKDHFCARITGIGTVNIAVRNCYPCIWLDTGIVWFDRLSYLPSIKFRGERWTTFVSDELEEMETREMVVSTSVTVNAIFVVPKSSVTVSALNELNIGASLLELTATYNALVALSLPPFDVPPLSATMTLTKLVPN